MVITPWSEGAPPDYFGVMQTLSLFLTTLAFLGGGDLSAYCPDDSTPLNGYRDHRGYCIPGLISVDTWFAPMPEWTWGKAVFYGPGVMEATARWRGIDLSGYLDGVALPSCYHIGQTVWLRRGKVWEGPYVVADCAGRGDMYGVAGVVGEVVEVGWQTALRWEMARFTGSRYAPAFGQKAVRWQVEVEMWIGERELHPGQLSHREPVDYQSLFLQTVRFAGHHQPHPIYLEPGLWMLRHREGYLDVRPREQAAQPTPRLGGLRL